LALHLPAVARAGRVAPAAVTFAPNAWLRITADGVVTVIVSKSEMGQGVLTSTAMIVGEELDVDWTKVKTELAPAAAAYVVSDDFRIQLTGGSMSTKSMWGTLRQAGAAARSLLVAAAAKQWKVKPATCHTEKGEVAHESGKRLAYGALVDAAA